MVQEVRQFQTDNDHQRGGCCYGVHASASRHAYGSSHPQSCCRRQPAHGVLLKDDAAGTDEADARHHLCCYARHVVTRSLVDDHVAEAVSRQYHKQAATQSHEEVRAEAGLLGTVLTFQSDGSAQQAGNQDSKNKICCHIRCLSLLVFIRLQR